VAQITIRQLQLFLRDQDPAANLLLDEHEFDPEELTNALQIAVDKWNDTPPLVGTYTVDTFPWPTYLRYYSAAVLLRSAALRYARNQLRYSGGGAAIDDQNKEGTYNRLADVMQRQADNWFVTKKNTLNFSNGFSSI